MAPPPDGQVRLEATVHGRVQGVGYRFFIIRVAGQLGLAGWVANEADGSVRLVAEGDAAAVGELEAELRRGPRGAVVDRVVVARMPASGGFDGFDIRSSGHTGD